MPKLPVNLIALDLDDTLLNDDRQITDLNVKALRECVQKGIYVVLCSGRISSSIENIANEVGANHYLIGGNGTIVYDIKEQKTL